jgi:double-strand break repair protein MRE11
LDRISSAESRIQEIFCSTIEERNRPRGVRLSHFWQKECWQVETKNNPDAPDEEEEEWEDNDENPAAATVSERLSKLRMASLVKQYLQAQNLEVLVENGLEDAVMRFVDKDDKDAIKDFVADTLRSVGRDMKSKDMDEDDVEEHVSFFHRDSSSTADE